MKPEDQKSKFEKVTIIFVQVCVTNLYNRRRHKENLGLSTDLYERFKTLF